MNMAVNTPTYITGTGCARDSPCGPAGCGCVLAPRRCQTSLCESSLRLTLEDRMPWGRSAQARRNCSEREASSRISPAMSTHLNLQVDASSKYIARTLLVQPVLMSYTITQRPSCLHCTEIRLTFVVAHVMTVNKHAWRKCMCRSSYTYMHPKLVTDALFCAAHNEAQRYGCVTVPCMPDTIITQVYDII